MVSSPITSWEIDGETMETVRDFIFLGSKITADANCSHALKRCVLLGRKAMTHLLLLLSHSVVSDSSRPHGQQPTSLLGPCDLPGKSTGVGCHFLLQCMKVKSESEVAQLCRTLRDPVDCSPPGSSVHGICQARALEWVPSPSP